ncbi:MFS transporter [Metallosphaera sedula]|uniref:MFS transporter n=2 Tax=Metallosphaera TaxID=41980 RepID=A0A0K1SHW0_9CREN|nr:MFS transporter [Metallosphaera sedula]QCO29250.1 MFS transporter [Metallosphaera prunae]AKV76373.1 MFS transporter [Metallosphaera sedula]AKV78624.1 MFS transporter [Metallosphaera sedula]AKV80869.1 MFS transporter [Metallosphaera sedula]
MEEETVSSPPGKLKSFFISSAGFLLDGYDLSVISFALLFLPKELHLTPLQEGLVSSASLMGMILGSVLLGLLSDKMGRKRLMGLDLVIFTVFAITSALSQNFLEMFLSRLLLGVGIGGDYPLSSSLMAEYSPSRSRGRYLVGAVSMYWVGTLLSAVVNLVFLPTGDYFWRYSFAFGALLSIPVIVARFSLPESPRWLISKGKLKGDGIPTQEEENKGVTGFLDLFRMRLLPYLLLVSAIWFLFDVASYGIGLYYPAIFREFSLPSNYEVIYATMIIAVGAILGYILAEVAIDSLGRRAVLLSGLGVMALLLAVGGVLRLTGVVLVPYFAVFVAMEQWAGAVTLFYPAELFPTPVRSSAQGFATAVSRIGAVLGVVFFPSMVKVLGLSNSLILFSVTSAIAFILALLLRETKRKELEEISLGLKEVKGRNPST